MAYVCEIWRRIVAAVAAMQWLATGVVIGCGAMWRVAGGSYAMAAGGGAMQLAALGSSWLAWPSGVAA
jgi:hypothetical protein